MTEEKARTKAKIGRAIGRMARGILLTLVAALAAAVIWLAVDKLILRSPVPSLFGYAILTVETGSMEGAVSIGDMIVIRDTGDYRVGDIVTYLPADAKVPTTHRIVGVNGDGTLVTKGDANNTQDRDPVERESILGEVVKTVPHAGLILGWLTREGLFCLVALLCALGVGMLVRKRRNGTNDDTAAKRAAFQKEGK